MSSTPVRKAAISVQPFLWRPTEVVAKAIQRTAELNLTDFTVELMPNLEAPLPREQTLYNAFEETMNIAAFMQTICAADYTMCVKPVELSTRTGIHTWKHAVILVGVRHRDGYEMFLFGEVNDEPLPAELVSTLMTYCKCLGDERRTPNPPDSAAREIMQVYDVIGSSVEQLLRRKSTTLN